MIETGVKITVQGHLQLTWPWDGQLSGADLPVCIVCDQYERYDRSEWRAGLSIIVLKMYQLASMIRDELMVGALGKKSDFAQSATDSSGPTCRPRMSPI